MISDYHKAISLRTVTQASDGAGGFTETTSDATIYGYIAEYTGAEILRNKQIGNDATCELFTESTIPLTSRIVDGSVVYEVVWEYSNFHKRYPLKRVT